MPKLGNSSWMFVTQTGAELSLGTVADQVHEAARTDTYAADGERWVYRSGATLIEQRYDAITGAWRAQTLA